jgi:hypothetical protein
MYDAESCARATGLCMAQDFLRHFRLLALGFFGGVGVFMQ